jgi:tetratricopeptide (TPR) repeat protein
VFWKILEFLVRLVYFRRFYKAKKIGQAGALLSEGEPEKALVLLEKTGRSIHESLLPLYAFTRGKIMLALNRTDEAEKAFETVVLTDHSNAKADLELALITGRQNRLKECRRWLERALEKNDDIIIAEAEKITSLLNDMESGALEESFKTRAYKMARQVILPPDKKLNIPFDENLLKIWIKTSKEDLIKMFDEVALLIGQTEVEKGAKWQVNLAIDSSTVIKPDGTSYNPFEWLDDFIRQNS